MNISGAGWGNSPSRPNGFAKVATVKVAWAFGRAFNAKDFNLKGVCKKRLPLGKIWNALGSILQRSFKHKIAVGDYLNCKVVQLPDFSS